MLTSTKTTDFSGLCFFRVFFPFFILVSHFSSEARACIKKAFLFLFGAASFFFRAGKLFMKFLLISFQHIFIPHSCDDVSKTFWVNIDGKPQLTSFASTFDFAVKKFLVFIFTTLCQLVLLNFRLQFQPARVDQRAMLFITQINDWIARLSFHTITFPIHLLFN